MRVREERDREKRVSKGEKTKERREGVVWRPIEGGCVMCRYVRSREKAGQTLRRERQRQRDAEKNERGFGGEEEKRRQAEDRSKGGKMRKRE